MNQHPQLSTGQVAGGPLHALEQHPRDEVRNAVTANVIENWIDEADRLYTAAPAAALGFEILGRSSKFRGTRIRSFSKTTPRADRILEMSATKNTGPRRLAVAGLMLCLGLTMTPANGAALGAAGADTVRGLYATLLANMRSGPALGAHGRYIRIEPVVRRTFDMQFMTRPMEMRQATRATSSDTEVDSACPLIFSVLETQHGDKKGTPDDN